MPYFDNAATTFPKPEDVYKFTDEFYRNYGVNVGRGQHKQAAVASSLVGDTRKRLLELFHAPAKKIVFTHSATEAINIILQGIEIKDNYNIYISPFEHNAVTRVLHHLKSKYKLNVIELLVDTSDMSYDLEGIKYQFAEKAPNVVIMSHASNVCGLIAPINEICTLAKNYNAITLIDMAQTAGLVDVDLSQTIYDFAVFAGHKTLYSTFGIAGFLCNDIKLEPLMFGGTGVDSANQNLPDTIPEKYEVGSPNIMAIAGLNASLKWIEKIGLNNIFEKERLNHMKLVEILSKFDNISIVGENIENSIGVVSCVFDGYSSDNIGQVLSEYDIAVRTGLHCAPIAHKKIGTFPAGTVRFSVSFFNTDDDFAILEEALNYIEENS